MDAADTSLPPLEYAPRPPVQRRRALRRAAWPVLLMLLAILAWLWVPPYAKQVRYLYWQSRCLSFVAPADRIAYEDDPMLAAALEKQPGYQRANPIGTQLPAGTQPPVGFVPSPLSKLSAGWVCMAFVGGRSVSGRERLVVLGYQLHDLGNGSRQFDLCGSGKILATLRPGDELLQGSGGGITFHLNSTDRLRLFWGQRDPNEPDRFTSRTC